jgi:hypothetical protein
MAELIVMVCLLATPEKCQEFKVPDAGAADVVTCIRDGGVSADEWQVTNDKYFIIGWRCATSSKAPVVQSAQ